MTHPPRNMSYDLPFLINGTATAEEQAQMRAALQADPALAQEAKALTALRAAMKAEEPGPTPGEFGLARLMRDIRAETAAPPVATPAQPNVTRLRVQGFAVAAALAGAAALLLPSLTAPPTPAPVYEQASGDMAADLVVGFRTDAGMADISELLLAEGLVIVDGPSAVGLYRLASFDGADPAQSLERLSARTALIDFVELAE